MTVDIICLLVKNYIEIIFLDSVLIKKPIKKRLSFTYIFYSYQYLLQRSCLNIIPVLF